MRIATNLVAYTFLVLFAREQQPVRTLHRLSFEMLRVKPARDFQESSVGKR
jgi:hypothetical protein